jgi:hypothetical protein
MKMSAADETPTGAATAAGAAEEEEEEDGGREERGGGGGTTAAPARKKEGAPAGSSCVRLCRPAAVEADAAADASCSGRGGTSGAAERALSPTPD